MSVIPGGAGMRMQVAITTEAANGETKTQKFDIELDVAEQRKLAENEAGGPCFRMWLTEPEKNSVQFIDWTCYRLKDGRYAVWRKEADLDALKKFGEMRVYDALNARRLTDDVE